MSEQLSFDDVLDDALDSLRGGTPLESVLAAHPGHAAALRPILETALALGESRDLPPPPQRLDANFSVVRSALRDARGARAPSDPQGRAWWLRRRMTFASFSLPLVSVAAIAVAGTSGAAAATLVVTKPAVMRHAAETIAPDWLPESIPALNHDRDSGSTSASDLTPLPTSADPQPSTMTASLAEAEITVAGAIHAVRGSTFLMSGTSGDWHVVADRDTSTTGIVVDGAIATVRGRASGNTLHAINIAIRQADGADDSATPGVVDTPAPQDAPTSTPPGNSGDAPGLSGTPPGNSSSAPGHSSTPPGNSGSAPGQNKTPTPVEQAPEPDKTPPGQAKKTKTPPGQGNGNRGGSENP